MGRYSIKKTRKQSRMKSKRIDYVHYPVSRSDVKRWYERARELGQIELLNIIAGLQRMDIDGVEPVFPANHPQLIIYKKVAGVEGSSRLVARKTEITDYKAANKKQLKHAKAYASVKNRRNVTIKADVVDWEKAFSMNTARAAGLPWV